MNKPQNIDKRETLSFKISPRLIDLFGKDLVARTEAALAELVKNAYDSDAKHVTLKFNNVKNPGGTLTITDDGDGMSLQDIRDKWMLIGTKDKVDNPTTRRRRRKVGEKGIGRFGAHKLSNRTVLKTKRPGQPNWVVLNIDWSRYYTDQYSFEEIIHPYHLEPGKLSDHGTILELSDLRDGFTRDTFERLQAELTLLVPPLPGIRDFRIVIESHEFPEFMGELQPAILKAANYILEAKYDGNGKLAGTLKIKGEGRAHPIAREVAGALCGPMQIYLYVYVLKKESFEGLPLQLSKVKSVLDVFKGIRIYRDNFKVATYGDQGNDWLGIDEQHIRQHEVVIHSKQVIGAVHVSRDMNPELIDTTNREGLVANKAFFDLINVCQLAIEEINNQRWHERRLREEAAKKKGSSPVDQALDRIENATAKDFLIPADVKKEIQESISRVRTEQESQTRRMEDELQMYRNLASLGISTAAFAHETEAIGLDLTLYLNQLDEAIKSLPDKSSAHLTPIVDKITDAGRRSIQLVDLLLEYVRQKKQKLATVSISSLLDEVLLRYEPFLRHMHISAKATSQSDLPSFHCVPMDMEAIFINLLTNAAWAIKDQNRREIRFDLSLKGKNLVVLASDTGKGIHENIADKIFNPFFTTKGPKGIGLGLTIVRDTIRKYQGDIVPIIPGKLGGATFKITIPFTTGKTKL